MNAQQLENLIKAGKATRKRVASGGPGIYFRVASSGNAFWVYRYTINGVRKEITVGTYGSKPHGIPLGDIADEAADFRKQHKEGKDPSIERAFSHYQNINTLDQLAEDWFQECDKRLKYPEIPKRVYRKDLSPVLGKMNIKDIRKPHIYQQIRTIRDSGRPTIASDALVYCKQLFDHAETIGLIEANPAASIMPKRLNLIEKARQRVLTKDELKHFFEVAKSNPDQFVIENYLACILLVCLGVRKTELLAATWEELDLSQNVWRLPGDRTKTGTSITYPLDDYLVEMFDQLKARSLGSGYVFPNRRASKRFKHISPDTLNAAIAKLFKQQKLTIPHFTIHDFRRTFRTLLGDLKVAPHIAEKCLNHKLPKIMAIYDTHDYFEERKHAHALVVQELKEIF
ncbi:tyrosine-type recombinase/integrase [Vibrio sp. 10N.222.55.A3]|uniref:tyrosine-type recombinase/integrase n=1 Tax=unclassified Vibrio TaxID=2614977 RepID=UPI003553F1CA